MSRILIYGGTTEGRILAETLADNKISCDLCVATDYGELVIKPSSYINIYTGRLSVQQMKELYAKNKVELIIDATHPYATLVSQNIVESADGIPVIRYERCIKRTEISNFDYFETVDECVKTLEKTEGKILVTTGSKEISTFCKNDSLKERLVVRVLPAIESLKLCYEAGLEGKQIIAMQGPFSLKTNITQIEENGISVIVTKESGKTGGEDTKLNAAIKTGIKCFIIRKPENAFKYENVSRHVAVRCNSLQEVCIEIKRITKLELETNYNDQDSSDFMNIVLAGIGMGNPDTMTAEVKNHIEKADYIFGATRMLESVHCKAEKFPFYLAKDIIPEIKKIQQHTGSKNIVVLFSGDTGFYSGAALLKKELEVIENADIKVLPGISSIQMMAARFQCSWQNARIMSLHGVEKIRWQPELENYLLTENQIFMLTSGPEDINNIGKAIIDFQKREAGFGVEILVGYRLSYDDEELYRLTAEGCLKIQKPGLYSVMLIINKNKKE